MCPSCFAIKSRLTELKLNSGEALFVVESVDSALGTIAGLWRSLGLGLTPTNETATAGLVYGYSGRSLLGLALVVAPHLAIAVWRLCVVLADGIWMAAITSLNLNV